jgi:hypothetical protein
MPMRQRASKAQKIVAAIPSFLITFPPEKVVDTYICSWSGDKVMKIGSIFINSLPVTLKKSQTL